MKTAILISGHMRTFARCLPTLAWHVFRHFPNADFYVSTVKDNDSDSVRLLRDRYPKARIALDLVDAQPELPIPLPPVAPDWTVGRMYSHEPYAISVHPQAIVRQLWQLERVWRLMEQETKANPPDGPYDTIIRCRPDSWFRSFAMPSHPFVIHSTVAYTPWWGRFGGCNDRFAILGATAAEAYFSTYTAMPALLAAGCPLHTESLVKASIEAQECIVWDTLRAEFSKLYGPENPKLNGTFRDPEISPIDIAHLGAC